MFVVIKILFFSTNSFENLYRTMVNNPIDNRFFINAWSGVIGSSAPKQPQFP